MSTEPTPGMDDHWEVDVAKGTCSIEDCASSRHRHGWCIDHWRLLAPRCAIDGCSKPEFSRGWCSAHYSAWYRHGDPLWQRSPRTCLIEGCDRPYLAQDMCAKHYARWARRGSPELAPSRKRTVTFDGDVCVFTITELDGSTQRALCDRPDAPLLERMVWRFNTHGYLVANLPGEKQVTRFHRYILGLGEHTRSAEVDHRNGDRSDNRRSNLRLIPHGTNTLNRQVVNGKGTSRYRGVYWCATFQRWKAEINQGGQRLWIRSFRDEDEAAAAVADMRRQLNIEPGY